MRAPRTLDRVLRCLLQHRLATHIGVFGFATLLLAVLK